MCVCVCVCACVCFVCVCGLCYLLCVCECQCLSYMCAVCVWAYVCVRLHCPVMCGVCFCVVGLNQSTSKWCPMVTAQTVLADRLSRTYYSYTCECQILIGAHPILTFAFPCMLLSAFTREGCKLKAKEHTPIPFNYIHCENDVTMNNYAQ